MDKIKNKDKDDCRYGIICIYKPTKSVILIRRKFTISFTVFIKGVYNPYDIINVNVLIKCMTTDEQDMLMTKTFAELWRILGFYNDNEIYYESLSKYNRLDEFVKNIYKCTFPKFIEMTALYEKKISLSSLIFRMTHSQIFTGSI